MNVAINQTALDDCRQLNWLIDRLRHVRLPLEDEKRLQQEIARRLDSYGIEHQREVQLYAPPESAGEFNVHINGHDMKVTGVGIGIIDFFVPSIGAGIEVKIKGTAKDLTRQLRRYAEDERINQLVVLTAKSFALPDTIGRRRVLVDSVNIARGWL